MSNSRKIILVSLFAGLLALLVPILYAENGFFDLQRLRNEKKMLIIENSKIGLKLLDLVEIIKRLAKNDLNLIEHIARTNLKMVAKDELVFISRESEKESKPDKHYIKPLDDFRILTENEFKDLLNFDILSLKFFEKLNISESSVEDETGSTKKDLDNSISSKEKKIQSEKSNVAKALKQYEIRKKENPLDEQKGIAIQLAAFRDRKRAESLIKKYKQKNYYAYMIKSKGSEGVPWYKVRIGKFRNLAQAKRTLESLKKDNLKPIIVEP